MPINRCYVSGRNHSHPAPRHAKYNHSHQRSENTPEPVECVTRHLQTQPSLPQIARVRWYASAPTRHSRFCQHWHWHDTHQWHYWPQAGRRGANRQMPIARHDLPDQCLKCAHYPVMLPELTGQFDPWFCPFHKYAQYCLDYGNFQILFKN